MISIDQCVPLFTNLPDFHGWFGLVWFDIAQVHVAHVRSENKIVPCLMNVCCNYSLEIVLKTVVLNLSSIYMLQMNDVCSNNSSFLIATCMRMDSYLGSISGVTSM